METRIARPCEREKDEHEITNGSRRPLDGLLGTLWARLLVSGMYLICDKNRTSFWWFTLKHSDTQREHFSLETKTVAKISENSSGQKKLSKN